MQWVIGLPVLALAMGYLSEMWQRHTVTRQRDEAVRDLAAAREQLADAREQRAQWLAWARTIDVSRIQGWERAAGLMARWGAALDEDSRR